MREGWCSRCIVLDLGVAAVVLVGQWHKSSGREASGGSGRDEELLYGSGLPLVWLEGITHQE